MLNHDQLIALLKSRIRTAGTQKTFAKQIGISPQYLSDVLAGRRMPNRQILKALGYECVPCYKRIYHIAAGDTHHVTYDGRGNSFIPEHKTEEI